MTSEQFKFKCHDKVFYTISNRPGMILSCGPRAGEYSVRFAEYTALEVSEEHLVPYDFSLHGPCVYRNQEDTLVASDGISEVWLLKYTDPDRKSMSRAAARYLNKPDIENRQRPLQIISSGHVPEILRGEQARFEFHNVSKEVYDHLTTYRLMNMRVAGGLRATQSKGYVMPVDRMKNPDQVRESIEKSFGLYNDLLDSGETRQVARNALGVAAMMAPFQLEFSFLLLAQSVFNQRIWDVGAQGNTVRIVRLMWELVKRQDEELWQVLFDTYGPPKIAWDEVRRKFDKSGVTVGSLIATLQDGLEHGLFNETDQALSVLRQQYGDKKSMWEGGGKKK